jgi:ATP-dependent DNA helicase DinG
VARGNRSAVLAAARDAEPGEILLHNHPSGSLEPSDADVALAARVYEEGLGTAIVDNGAGAVYVVVEPPQPRPRPRLDALQVEALLSPGGELARVHPAYEDRPAQRAMLRDVIDRYNDGGISVVEAGTGTGKSLAYLLPAASWALAGGGRTVVSTNTINLQEQIVRKDLPLVRGLVEGELDWALVKGRGNYVSIRRLSLAAATAPALFETDRGAELDALLDWVGTTEDGSLSDLSASPSEEVWEEVRSDADVCMGARCAHFQGCFYQKARREAGSAHLLVVNHALLFADLSVRGVTQNWSEAAVLPPYRHVVLDEAHNLEDAATRHLGVEVTRTGLFRALDRLDRNGRGLLNAVDQVLAGVRPSTEADGLRERVVRIRRVATEAREALTAFFDALEPSVPSDQEEPLTLGRGDPRDPGADLGVSELLDRVRAEQGRLVDELERLRGGIEADVTLADGLAGRLLDLHAVQRRLDAARHGLSLILGSAGDQTAFVRWIEGRWRPGGRLVNVLLAAAPIEPGTVLRDALFGKVDSAVVTSATLSTGEGGFEFVRGRLGLSPLPGGSGVAVGGAMIGDVPVFADSTPDAGEVGPALDVTETLLRSPFDYSMQTVFCVPTDQPGPQAWESFQAASARIVSELAQVTDGGIFALFTSHRALRSVAHRLRESGEDRRWPLMVHGEAPRTRLLDDFTRSENGILLGTASFWEGVDVPGRPLRGLVLQKIPFRVPTEPVTRARMSALEARGTNPFGAYLVPLAALRLKQGFGRLIRSREDRGGIVLLDSRILTRSYGPALLGALPEAPLVTGPWESVRRRLKRFYAGAGETSAGTPGA